jgi:hypothetical protein
MSEKKIKTYAKRTPSRHTDHEADHVSWVDEESGLPCVMKRHPRSGHWCGYVGVPPGHSEHGKDWDSARLKCHGGVTYADGCDGDPEMGVCHVPEPGEPDDVWGLGFDYAHSGDLSPWVDNPIFDGERYWTQSMVERDVEDAASDLHAMTKGESDE